ncbi:MAG TPA: hypothetical protein VMG10_27895 [Gemmataceae bacterium]|nr:hypothetical protein [Gemmataceae bacterium]
MAKIIRLATLRRSVAAAVRCFCEASLTGVLLGLMLATPAQAITMTFGDIEITPQPPPKGNSWHGYCEYVFHVHNKSAERPHTVSLSLPFERRFAHDDTIRELRRSVEVGANETVRLSLLQPDYPPIYGSDVEVTLDGRRQDRELPLTPNETRTAGRYYYRHGYSVASAVTTEPLLLMGARVKPLPTVETAIPGGFGGPGMMMPGGMAPPGMAGPAGMGGQPGMAGGAGQPGAAPGSASPRVIDLDRPLAAYFLLPTSNTLPCMVGTLSSLAIGSEMGEIIMAPGKPGLPGRGFQLVSAESWSNNWLAYSRYDGIIITADELRSLPAEVRAALWQYVETGGAMLVLGKADLRGLSAISESTQHDAGWTTVRAGFGVCRVSPDANYDKWDENHFAMLAKDWTSTWSAWQGRRGTLDANQQLPVIESLGIPVKGLFVLMFLFTLGIGPINLLVLTRLKRRIWMLWTTPAISLCTCLAVFGYMLISEGWQGQLRSETLTLLDETTHRATTIGWTGVYSPLTPGDGLHFRYETEVIPQRYFEGRDGGARSCTIDWSQDQHFAAGWVEARVPAHFKVRKSEMRRERVTLRHERDGRWSMVNGLGVPIEHFWYADDKGQIHMAENVAAGARAMLTLTEKESPAPVRTMQSFLSGSWMLSMKMMAASPQHYLRPGLYLAEVDGSPFLEDALPNARARKAHALVLGFGTPAASGGR